MKLGVVTFHHIYNYGAFLQAHALQRYLDSTGVPCELIDYRNEDLEQLHERCIRYDIRPLKWLANRKRRGKFRALLAKAATSPMTRAVGEVKWSDYDAVFYGADEIWNHHDHSHGFDPAYFGGGAVEVTRCFGYAPSLGQLAWDTPAHPRVGDLLKRYSGIAVRDENTALFVERQTGTKPAIVLDPVFLWSFDHEVAPCHADENQVLVYGEIRDPQWIQSWRSYARKRKFRTVSVGFQNSWCDETRLAAGPFEFLSILRSSRLVITSTFHGTMFALKWGIPFATWRPGGARRKFDPLLSELGQSDRLAFTPPADWDQLLAPLDPSISRQLEERVMASKAMIGSFLERLPSSPTSIP